MMQHGSGKAHEVFSSNAVRLSTREWSVVIVVLAVVALFTGRVWQRIEPFDPVADYRIPYDLAEDYWFFDRFCGETTDENKVLVFGDSFVWGQYVENDETLTHFLNQQAGAERFVNAGLDGAHPMALGGLLEHHCSGLGDRDVVVHLNLLWLSSAQADLQMDREFRLNHPRLVPQFTPWLPSYRQSVSGRIGIVVSRYVPVFDWGRHVQITYFDNSDLVRWSVEHPYANPLGVVTLRMPEPGDDRIPTAEPWSVRGRVQQDLPWVELEGSVQWLAFRRVVERLQARRSRVAVIIGPLNEHMLAPPDVGAYRRLLDGAETWLRDNNFTYYSLSTLPSDLYADLSHPLGQGYAQLAEQLTAQGLSSWPRPRR
jgi:hypothetical protein